MAVTVHPEEAKLASPEGGEVQGTGTALRLILRTFIENKLAVVGLGLIVLIVLFCYVGPLIYHTNQVNTNLNALNLPPSGRHLLGTDNNGYDILGRLMKGGQISVEVGLAVALVATAIGVVYGAISGFFGKLLDVIMMRVVDIGLAIPIVFLFIYVSRIFKPTVLLLILLLSVISWLGPARLVRGEVLSLRTREYVQAVRAMGGRSRRIILRHLVPNAAGSIVVNATLTVANAILTEAALSYLGLGVQPPQVDLGSLIANGEGDATALPWLFYFPAAFLIVAVLSVNFIGDGLRDALDPTQREH